MSEEPTPKKSIFEYFKRLHSIEAELYQVHGLRKEGAYAERLVATALEAAVLKNGVTRGHDLHHPTYGRIEVRSRRRPLDSRQEFRLTVEEKKRGQFDYCVHVSFDRDYTVIGAYLIPHDALFAHLDSVGRNKVRHDVGSKLPGATDITEAVQKAQAVL
jgi:hypothetical protein